MEAAARRSCGSIARWASGDTTGRRPDFRSSLTKNPRPLLTAPARTRPTLRRWSSSLAVGADAKPVMAGFSVCP
ncbi:NotI family restriction endonuclease [Metapseudomonas otitidis]|uniref:NotI family restriction endonuclease n=1 Tax=Metapseudomonas otitidis TaxID=319939 RepID=UPI00373FD94B